MTNDETAPILERRNFYGRRAGHTLRPSQKIYLTEDLESLRPRGVTMEENPGRLPLDFNTLFDAPKEIWLEIGFGDRKSVV